MRALASTAAGGLRRVLLLAGLLGSPLLGGGCSRDVTYTASPPWPDRPLLPPLGAGLVFVTNSGDDTVSVLDLQTLEPRARLPVGLTPVELEGPHHLALSPAQTELFVGLSYVAPRAGSGPHGAHGTGTADGYALKLDAATGALLGHVRVDRSPGDIRLTPDGRYVLMSHFDLLRVQQAVASGAARAAMDSNVAILDAGADGRAFRLLALAPTCPAGHGLLAAADSRSAYVACHLSDELAVLDLTSPTLAAGASAPKVPTALVSLGSDGRPPPDAALKPYALTLSPLDGAVWVSCWGTGELRVYEPGSPTGAVDSSRTVAVGGTPMFGDFTRDGSLLLLPTQQPDVLSFVDPVAPAAQAVIFQLPLPAAHCKNAHAVRFRPDERTALLVCEGDQLGPGSLVEIDVALRTVVRSVPLGVYPDDLAIRVPR
jgi:YVTN family beta-propeller protein